MKTHLVMAAITLMAISADAQIITTIAGTGTAGYTGDGGSAVSAQVRALGDVAVDANGNVYFTQETNHVVRKVNGISGIVTTVAGNGVQGFSADGVPATSASLGFSGTKSGVAVDANGTIYISDFLNGRIRKVDPITGIISTLATINGPSDLAIDGAGGLYVACFNSVKRVEIATGLVTTVAGGSTTGFSGDGGPATAASLRQELRIAVGNGKLYIADIGNFRVRAVDLISGTINTIAGGGSSYSDGVPATTISIWPRCLAVDGNGDLYIGTSKLFKLVTSTGIINTVIGGSGYYGDYGPASAAQISESWGLAIGNSGNILIADTYNNRVRNVWSCILSLSASVNKTFCQNSVATPLTSTVGGTGAFTFQWYSNTSATQNGAALIPGATSASYVPPTSVLGSTYYFARITGTCGTLATPYHTVTINPQMAIVTQPSTGEQTRCMGGGNPFAPISVVASGTNLTYEWYYNTTKSYVGSSLLGGITGPTFTPPSGWLGTKYYFAKVKGCTTLTSDFSGPITVYQATTITAQPSGDYSRCQYQESPTFTVGAAGGNLTYQWYRNTTQSNSGGTLIPGANSASYSPSTSIIGTFWHYVIVSGTCGTVTSNVSGRLTVNPLLVITSQPSSSGQLLCQNASAVPLSVTATGPGTLTYQWYSSTSPSGSNIQIIAGATGSSYTPSTAVTGTNYYYVYVYGSCGPAQSSRSGAIVVNSPTVITGQPASAPQTVCQGLPLNALSVQATGSGLSYQWYSNTTSTNTGGSAISGATGATYTPSSAASGAKYYYVVVTGNCGTTASSPSGQITVTPSTSISVHPSTLAQAVCQGSSVNPLMASATGAGTITYQWYSNSSPTTSGGTAISGASSNTYTPLSATPGTKYYYVNATGSCGTVTSNVSGAITVNSIPLATISGALSFCPGSTTSLTSSSGASYLWSTGATTQSITVATAGTYSVTVTSSAGCTSTSSTVTTNLLSGASSITYSGSICDGPVYLTAGLGSGYLWDQQSSRSIWAYSEGVYSVTYYNTDGCFVTASVNLGGDCVPGGGTQSRKSATEADESNGSDDKDFKLGIYPNPAQNELLIVLTEPAKQDCPVRIYDLLGRLTKSTAVEKGFKSKTINITDLQTGVYVVDITDNKRNRQRRLVVQRD